MFERFTEDARAVVLRAQEQAAQTHAARIGTEHLLLALLDDDQGPTTRLLARLGVDAAAVRAEAAAGAGTPEPGLDAGALATLGINLEEVRERVERAFGPGALARGTRAGGGRIPFAAGAKKSLELALREAIALGDRHIGADHVLLGVLREEDGLGGRVLRARGIERAAVVEALGARAAG